MKTKKVFFQFITYVLIGGINFLLNLGIINLLMYITKIYSGFFMFIFGIIAFIIYSTNGFFMNKKLTFKSNTKNTAYFSYISVMAIAAIVNSTLLTLFSSYNFLNINPLIWANISIFLTSIITGTLSFLVNKFFVFKS